MRRALLLLPVLFVACSSSPSGFYTATYSETQTCIDAGAGAGMTCTGSVPASAATGANLAWVDTFRLRICAPSPQTISDAGVMQAYLCDRAEGLCYRAGALDQPVLVKGSQCLSFLGPTGDIPLRNVSEKADSLEYVASGVILTGSFNADAGLTEEILTHRQRQ